MDCVLPMNCVSVSVNLLPLSCGLLSNYFLWETKDLHSVACPRSSPETWHMTVLSWPVFWQQCGLCKGLINTYFIQFSSASQSCPTLCNPMDCSTPGLPVHHQLPEFTQTHVHWVGDAINHLILCCPLLLLPSIFPSIRVFSNELALHIRWLKYWSFSFNISPSNERPGLISFRVDWLDLLAYLHSHISLLKCQMNIFIDFFTITMISHSLRQDAVGARFSFAYQLLAKDHRESDSLPLGGSPWAV